MTSLNLTNYRYKTPVSISQHHQTGREYPDRVVSYLHEEISYSAISQQQNVDVSYMYLEFLASWLKSHRSVLNYISAVKLWQAK